MFSADREVKNGARKKIWIWLWRLRDAFMWNCPFWHDSDDICMITESRVFQRLTLQHWFKNATFLEETAEFVHLIEYAI